MSEQALGRAEIRQAVSRETADRLDLFAAELQRWQAVTNLVSASTLAQVWSRHMADSLQLLNHAPSARRWLDLGSGAGFPGLVLAIALGDDPGAAVHLIESSARKCAFLRHVAGVTGARAEVHESRLETAIPELIGQVDVVTARALARLDRLFAWTHPLLEAGAIALFPKGRTVQAELTEAGKFWKFTADTLPSLTDSQARIVRVTSLEPQPTLQPGQV